MPGREATAAKRGVWRTDHEPAQSVSCALLWARGGIRKTLPALSEQRRFDPRGVGDDDLETRLEEQQHELVIKFEAQGAPERRVDGESAEFVTRSAHAPEFERARSARKPRGTGPSRCRAWER
jgi:hypothetical protein